jgi:hypothetical protein
MSAAPAASLDSLGVPQPLRDRAKILWIITALGGLWGWVICTFVWKEQGQDENEWFQQQLLQNFYVGVISWVGYFVCGLGWLIGAILGLLGFLAIGKGEDYRAMMIGDWALKDAFGIRKMQSSQKPVMDTTQPAAAMAPAAAAAAAAAPDLSPVDSIKLEHWAWGRAQIAGGGTVDNVIGYLRVDRTRWERADAEWSARMARDATGTIAAECAKYGGR